MLIHGQVPQGFAAEEPRKYVLDDKEFERISKLAQLQLDDAREEEPESMERDTNDAYYSYTDVAHIRTGTSGKGPNGEDDDLKAYNLDTYDDESAEDEEKEGAGFLIDISN